MRGLPVLATGPGPVAYESAGTRAKPGSSMDPIFERSLASRGVDASEFRSRRLDRAMVESADLILTAERSHREEVVRLQPLAHRRTFTIAQAARLLQSVDHPTTGVQGVVEALTFARGHVPGQGPADDVADPYGGSVKMHQEVEAKMLSFLRILAEALGQHSGDQPHTHPSSRAREGA